MTVTTWLLLALAGATAFGCVAFLLPPLGGPPHPYETDPLADQGDHIGRRERPDDGPTRRLGDSRLRSPLDPSA